MTEPKLPNLRDLTTEKLPSPQKAGADLLISTTKAGADLLISTTDEARKRPSLQKAERWCLWAFLVQLAPPWLLLGLAHIAYAEPSVFSVRGEAFCTHLLLAGSAVAGLGMGGNGLYLLLCSIPWRRRSWGYAFLGWFAFFAGIVYAQALLIFWVWA